MTGQLNNFLLSWLWSESFSPQLKRIFEVFCADSALQSFDRQKITYNRRAS